jgi:hypothetical protein
VPRLSVGVLSPESPDLSEADESLGLRDYYDTFYRATTKNIVELEKMAREAQECDEANARRNSPRHD